MADTQIAALRLERFARASALIFAMLAWAMLIWLVVALTMDSVPITAAWGCVIFGSASVLCRHVWRKVKQAREGSENG